jgi:hypothetical protein
MTMSSQPVIEEFIAQELNTRSFAVDRNLAEIKADLDSLSIRSSVGRFIMAQPHVGM